MGDKCDERRRHHAVAEGKHKTHTGHRGESKRAEEKRADNRGHGREQGGEEGGEVEAPGLIWGGGAQVVAEGTVAKAVASRFPSPRPQFRV